MIDVLFLLAAALGSSDNALDAFYGVTIDTPKIRSVCLERAKSGKGYFPFCHDMVVTELGDAEFKKYYYGDALKPFLTREQALPFEQQIQRVNALSGTPAACVGASLDVCLGSLTTEFFVTSAATAPKWTPGSPIYGDNYVHFEAYPIPVLDPLSRFKEQLERPARVMLRVGPGETVRSATSNSKVGDGSVDSIMRSTFPGIIRAISGPCANHDTILSAARVIATATLETAEGGSATSGTARVCGHTISFLRFAPDADGLETPSEMLSLTWKAPVTSILKRSNKLPSAFGDRPGVRVLSVMGSFHKPDLERYYAAQSDDGIVKVAELLGS